MRKHIVRFAVAAGAAVLVTGGASAGAEPAINCAGFGNPGQATQTLGAAGPDRFQTPPENAAALGQPTVGAAVQFYCTTPADQP